MTDHIPAAGQVTAEKFAEWALLAEGLDPVDRQDLRRAIRNAFIRHMGTSSVSVGELDRWSEMQLTFRIDDLAGEPTQALVKRHLAGMHENSPPESVHALDLDKLRAPGVTFWSGWAGDDVAVMGALKQLDDENGEIKSMRVDDAFLGKGAGRAMLEHILAEAREMGLKTLWLETGSTEAFAPALKLYESAGFVFCGPFGDYKDDPFSRFMTKAL